MRHNQHQVNDYGDAIALAKVKPLSFDDINLPKQGAELVPANYGKLGWSSDFAVMDPAKFLKGAGYDDSGFFKGVTSGHQVGFNNQASPVGVAVKGSFDLNSVELTAAADKKLVVDIYAFKDGEQVGHDTVTITDTKATLVTLNYKGVDEVDFVPGKETPDKKFDPIGPYMVFDDLAVANVKGKASAPEMAYQTLHPSAFEGHGHAADLMLPAAGGHLDLHQSMAIA